MKHVRLLVLTENLAQASLALAETESFHPDPRPPEDTRLDLAPGHQYREVFTRAQSRLEKIGRLVTLPTPEIEQVRVVEFAELAELNAWLGGLWDEASGYEEDLRRLEDAERLVKEQQASLANFANLDIDLGMLRNKTRFLDFYVGLVPRENLRQLEGAVGLAHHLLHVYMQREETAHVVIVGPTGTEESQLATVLGAAGFQHLPIPRELDREPAELQRDLAAERRAIEKQRGSLHDNLERWSQPFRDRLVEARRTLLLAEPLVTLDPSLRSAGHLAHLVGWVPTHALESLEQRLHDSLNQPFDLRVRDPLPEERKLVPTVPVKSRFLVPFRMLVDQYGVPSYGEVDPTPLFAATFLLMFGMMFGDLGHGAVIALVAWSARRRLPRFYLFGVLAGISSMVFGLLFGSLFGYEEILPALWMSPLHDPILMLQVALGWGIAFILVACLLGIYNRLVTADPWGALFERHGLINLLFYLAFLWGGYRFAAGGEFGTLPALLAVGSLLALAAFQWRELQAPTGERLLVVAIETLDTVIVYVSNTLSFLRVAAFSLNHVALSLAIFTLADMMGSVGHLLTLVLGNLFVLVLEGGIVMIQVMRLQYYEGFSRYFSGDGHRFHPLRLRRGGASS